MCLKKLGMIKPTFIRTASVPFTSFRVTLIPLDKCDFNRNKEQSCV